MSSILVLFAANGSSAIEPMLETLGFAQQLGAATGSPVCAGLFGTDLDQTARALAAAGAQEVLVVDDARLASYIGDHAVMVTLALVSAAEADLVVVATDANAIEWAPRLAARLNAGIVTNCLSAQLGPAGLAASRSLAGGALQAECRLQRPINLLLTASGVGAQPASAQPGTIRSVAVGDITGPTQLVGDQPDAVSAGPQLKSARIVVAGGMGVGSADNWHLVEDAAAALDAAVGASRAAVDVGWAKSSMQVGFSGLTVKPDLYIALGISGALHHLAGISQAKTVVAVNNDPESNIFKASHIAVVGDVREVIPAFATHIQELRG